MDRNAEIALARSQAPDVSPDDATVLILGRHGYETAVEGKGTIRFHSAAASRESDGISGSPGVCWEWDRSSIELDPTKDPLDI